MYSLQCIFEDWCWYQRLKSPHCAINYLQIPSFCVCHLSNQSFLKYHNQLIFNLGKSGSWRVGNNWTKPCRCPLFHSNDPPFSHDSAGGLISQPQQAIISHRAMTGTGHTVSWTKLGHSSERVNSNHFNDSLTSKQAILWIDEAFSRFLQWRASKERVIESLEKFTIKTMEKYMLKNSLYSAETIELTWGRSKIIHSDCERSTQFEKIMIFHDLCHPYNYDSGDIIPFLIGVEPNQLWLRGCQTKRKQRNRHFK